MKSAIIACILVLSALTGMGQNTLQFSRVLMVGGTPQTVPAGTVWKVESVLPQSSFLRVTDSWYYTPAPSQSSDFVLLIDGNQVFVGEIKAGVTCGYNGSSSSTAAVYTGVDTGLFPMWLPAGTTLQASNNIRSVNVIEFTIVP